MDNSGYSFKKDYYNKLYNNKLKQIEDLKSLLANSSDELTERTLEVYSQRLKDNLSRLVSFKGQVDFVRLNTEEDLLERSSLLTGYSDEVREAIDDNVPVVFHGNRNIGTVIEIIRSGGLFTPEERNVSETSFATQIDVACKNNIRVSLEFAEPGLSSFLPYGAIFVFFPKEDEVDKVLTTKESTEVMGGVSGVNFINDPDRLVAIITTNENIELIKGVCESVGIDSSKVVNHHDFLILAHTLSYGITL